MTYKEIIRSENHTHFLYKGQKVFDRTFLNALKFHVEGFAPVQDASGWFHIDMKGNDLYTQRYDRTFGFYFKKAAVIEQGNWFHIDGKGNRIYTQSYAWCGNFQQNICTVRNHEKQYFHINTKGVPLYQEKYTYAGDFRDGYACVRLANGHYKHINKLGQALNQKLFDDLGVFHKSIATAKDKDGWFHINKQGDALYLERYFEIEPFYNGFALVENFEHQKLIIDEKGSLILTL